MILVRAVAGRNTNIAACSDLPGAGVTLMLERQIEPTVALYIRERRVLCPSGSE